MEANGPTAVWGSTQPSKAFLKWATFNDSENPPAINLPCKVWESVLDRYYIDVFIFLRPDADEGLVGPCQEKKGNKKRSVECIF